MFMYGMYECFVMQMLYVCVHPVSVLSAAFCMTCSLLILVEDARGDHMEEEYYRAGLITALYVAMSLSFCLPHPVAVSAFIIYSVLLLRCCECVCCMRVVGLK